MSRVPSADPAGKGPNPALRASILPSSQTVEHRSVPLRLEKLATRAPCPPLGLTFCLACLMVSFSSAGPLKMPRALAVSPDGTSVWVATEDGLWSLDVGRLAFTRHGTSEGLPSNRVNAVWIDPDRRVFVGTEAGACWQKGDSWCSESRGLPSPVVLSILRSRRDRTLFAGTDRGIARWDPRNLTFLAILDSHEFCRQPVIAIAEESSGGGVWFARERAFERLGLDGRFSIYQRDTINPDRVCPLLGRYPKTVAVSPSGAVWMPTDGGISRLRASPGGAPSWDEIPILSGPINPSGLPSAEVRAVAFGTDGAAWLAFGDAGMARDGLGVVRLLRDGSFTAFGKRHGLSSGRVHALAVGPDGTVWGATPLGLSCFRGQAWQSVLWP